MIRCSKCDKPSNTGYKATSYCSIQCFKGDMYNRMQEAKANKKLALEQQQLHAEFEANPLAYLGPPPIIKTEAEQKLDAAFSQLKEKLNSQIARLQEKSDQL